MDCEKLAPHRTLVTISMTNSELTSTPIPTKDARKWTLKTEDHMNTLATQHGPLIKVHRLPFDVQYQIFCDLPSPTWQRRSTSIQKFLPFESNLKLSDDKRMLYLTPASLFHNGNFTCKSGEMQQIHVVKVESSTGQYRAATRGAAIS
uniref:Uncharacterized protein n=1 Tax=Romanomermis culicivorax TaxID=13658 RepID=A0A915J3Y0_ROMCU